MICYKDIVHISSKNLISISSQYMRINDKKYHVCCKIYESEIAETLTLKKNGEILSEKKTNHRKENIQPFKCSVRVHNLQQKTFRNLLLRYVRKPFY